MPFRELRIYSFQNVGQAECKPLPVQRRGIPGLKSSILNLDSAKFTFRNIGKKIYLFPTVKPAFSFFCLIFNVCLTSPTDTSLVTCDQAFSFSFFFRGKTKREEGPPDCILPVQSFSRSSVAWWHGTHNLVILSCYAKNNPQPDFVT